MRKVSPIYILALSFFLIMAGKLVTVSVTAATLVDKSPPKHADTHVRNTSKTEPQAQTLSLPPEADAAVPISPSSNECTVNPSTLAQILLEKKQEYQDRFAELENREAILKKNDALIRDKFSQLKKLKEELENSVNVIKQSSSEDIASLTKMYEAMKPSQAGPLFDTMAPEFAAGFLKQMNAEAAALILANMTTEKAYAVSLNIAGNAKSLDNQLKN